jgi:hypothetical protein
MLPIEKMQKSLNRQFAGLGTRGRFDGSPGGTSRQEGVIDDPHPTGGKPGSTAEEIEEEQEEKERVARERAEKSKDAAKEGTPVKSPGSDKDAIGPMGGGPNANVVGNSRKERAAQLKNAGLPSGMRKFAGLVTRQLVVNEMYPYLRRG